MSRLQPVQPVTQSRHQQDEIRQRARSAERDVLTGPEFRQRLGWGKDRFYAAMHAGRFQHLIAVNASSAHRIVYVKELALAWIAQTRDSLRPAQSHRRSA